MIIVQRTQVFAKWLDGLRDLRGRARIIMRLDRMAMGHFGDAKAVGNGVSELRIDTGPGYRIYFIRSGEAIVVLLCGGDKSSQDRDIARAKAIALSLEEET